MLKMLAAIAVLALGGGAAAPARAANCVTDAAVEAAVGDQIRSGAFAVNAAMLDGKPLCSGLTLAQAIQKLRARYAGEAEPEPRAPTPRASEPPRGSAPTAGAAEPPRTWARQQFFGAWVPEGEICESDAGITFEPDGNWNTMDEGGTWSVAGDRLTLVTQERREDGESETLRVPERDTSIILRVDDHEMRQRWADGTLFVLNRCVESDAPAADGGQGVARDSDAVPPSVVGGARPGMLYAEVRKRIIGAGFVPEARPKDQFCGYGAACALPETDACAGAGEGQCSYNFRKGAERIYVVGVGDKEGEPQGQEVISILYW